MATLRKAGAYSKKYARPYTRVSKVKAKNFIKTVPASKITKFNMGNIQAYQSGKYDTKIRVICKENVQIRDNSIEAARQGITRTLEKSMPNQFYFEIKIHPHHIIRENKMLTGAGSDRMQTGMQRSFGKTIGRAAMVKENQELFFLATSGDKQIGIIRNAVTAIKARLPCKVQIMIEKIK
jgi:large subunit ribosomal protein L10e